MGKESKLPKTVDYLRVAHMAPSGRELSALLTEGECDFFAKC